ncbi:MAG: hypothetical protein ACLR8A_00055 [Bacteroides caccae]
MEKVYVLTQNIFVVNRYQHTLIKGDSFEKTTALSLWMVKTQVKCFQCQKTDIWEVLSSSYG